MSDHKITTPESQLTRFYPADPDGVFVSSNELTVLEIASCQSRPECWHVNDEGLGWAKINRDLAVKRLAIAAYRIHCGATNSINGDVPPIAFDNLPESEKAAWQEVANHLLFQVRY